MNSPKTEASPPPQSDEELIRQVLAGEIDRFSVLIGRHQVRVTGLVRRYIRSDTDAEEAIQLVFIKAFHKLEGWRRQSPFEHWLCRIALRVCLDKLRSRKRCPELLFSELSAEEEDWLKNAQSCPDEVGTESAAARELVWRAFEELSPRNRLVLDLFEIQGKRGAEISQLMQCSQLAVKMRLFRARRELKKILKKLVSAIELPCGKSAFLGTDGSMKKGYEKERSY
jgi:RNA polymerase sigma-70 factor (ECF subfamily)